MKTRLGHRNVSGSGVVKIGRWVAARRRHDAVMRRTKAGRKGPR